MTCTCSEAHCATVHILGCDFSFSKVDCLIWTSEFGSKLLFAMVRRGRHHTTAGLSARGWFTLQLKSCSSTATCFLYLTETR